MKSPMLSAIILRKFLGERMLSSCYSSFEASRGEPKAYLNMPREVIIKINDNFDYRQANF